MDIHRQIADLIGAGRRFVIAMVLSAEGSTPQEAGVKAVIDETGSISGTLGGGAVEAEAQRRAPDVCAAGRATVLEVDLFGETAAGQTPICGGSMRVLLDPAAAGHRDAYVAAADAVRARRRGVLLTAVRGADEAQVEVSWLAEGEAPPAGDLPDAEAIERCVAKETAELFAEGDAEVMVEPVVPRPLLIIAGGGHIGQALARQADMVGFDVTVIDDRPEFAEPALFPEGATAVCAPIAEELAAADLGRDSYVVIVTRGHRHDAEALAACIHSPAAYVGMIGSSRKVGLMREDFVESGRATEEEFDRVFARIGMDIGAVTVPEIATSILAELVAVRRKGRDALSAGHMVDL